MHTNAGVILPLMSTSKVQRRQCSVVSQTLRQLHGSLIADAVSCEPHLNTHTNTHTQVSVSCVACVGGNRGLRLGVGLGLGFRGTVIVTVRVNIRGSVNVSIGGGVKAS